MNRNKRMSKAEKELWRAAVDGLFQSDLQLYSGAMNALKSLTSWHLEDSYLHQSRLAALANLWRKWVQIPGVPIKVPSKKTQPGDKSDPSCPKLVKPTRGRRKGRGSSRKRKKKKTFVEVSNAVENL